MAKRGRPKGSGIDDRELLSDITRLLAATPGLKPTTAIKQAGVDDPSMIRRLRDKLRVDPPPVAAARPHRTPRIKPAPAKPAPAKPAPARKPKAKPQPRRRPAPVSRGTNAQKPPAAARPAARVEQSPGQPPHAVSPPELAPPETSARPRAAPATSWVEAQLAATATLLNEQARMCDAFLPLTPLPQLLRQQAALLDGLLHMLRDREKNT